MIQHTCGVNIGIAVLSMFRSRLRTKISRNADTLKFF